MKTFAIPVLAELPFTQEPDDAAAIVESPGDMAVFRMPSRSPANAEDEQAAADVIEALLAALRAWSFGAPDHPRFDLSALGTGCQRVLHETLGEGEVSGRLTPHGEIQETAFAGLWWVREPAADGAANCERLEACALPDAVRKAAAGRMQIDTPAPTTGLMNGPALLAEVVDRAARYRADDSSHVINLTLLPVTPEDLEYLDAALGRGGVSLLSRGYGNCRITATQLDGVWWVQYFNAAEKLLLNTLEIIDLPESALAAPEDIADTIERLADCLLSMRET
ncbi:hydrogenase expression/formation protein [Methylotetracoccus oryzae]|uniref:hydrogenase expression/formation protein n=1 Tax=Methylotetracoccus oryzae TaxID=1919059 RepID=UPI00111972A6|nr:hydrogenase expression/formation protein [Methylotetracoccus oryzae]